MKDSYSFDVDDAGLEASYQKHRDAYIRIFDRLGFEYVIVKADVRRHGRLEVRGVPRQGRRRRGHLRPLHQLRLRRQRRGRPGRPRPRPRRTTTRRPRTPSRRPTPRPSTRWSPTSTRSSRATTGPGRPPTPSRTCSSCSSTPTAPASRSRSALPGDREVDQKRLEGQLEPTEVEPFDEAEFADAPGAGQGLHRPRRAGGEEASPASASSSTPASSRAPAGSPAPTSTAATCIDLVAGRDFTADGTIEAAEVRDGDPCPNCDRRAPCESARGIEMGHIFQLGRKYADALDLQVLDENGKLVTVTMGSYGIGPSRAVAAIAEGTLDELGLCLAAQRRARRRAPGRHRQGRGGLRRRRADRPRAVAARASRCSTTTGPARSAPA